MRKSIPTAMCLFILVLSLLVSGCARGHESAQKSLSVAFPEFTAKQRLQEQTEDPSVVLSIVRQIKNRTDVGMVVPSAIAYSESGDLYVLDNNGQVVHRWKVGSDQAEVFLTQKAGTFNFPFAMEYADNKIYVSDNDGIKVFSADGQFEKLIRTYFGIFSFAVTPRGTILVNALVRNADSSDPLIVELDPTGKLIRGFGSRQNVEGHDGLEDRAFLAISNGTLFVAFKYRPTVEVYDIASGKLNRTVDIAHPVFRGLERAMLEAEASRINSPGQSLTPKYLAGIRTLGTRVFLCLYLPTPEIWELDESGRRVSQFEISSGSPALDIFGFDVRSTGSSVTLSLGTTNSDLSPGVFEVNTGVN